MCEERDVESFLKLNPSTEVLDVCTRRYTLFSAFNNQFSIGLIDKLIINVKHDIRYVLQEEVKEEQFKIYAIQEDLRGKLRSLPWPAPRFC